MGDERSCDATRRRFLQAAIGTGIVPVVDGVSAKNRAEEPNEPPKAVANGFDVDAARQSTAAAIREGRFAVFGHVTYFEDSDATEISDSMAEIGVGDGTVARYLTGSSSERELSERPWDTDRVDDRFYYDDTLIQRRVFNGVSYDREEDPSRSFADIIERRLEFYHRPGDDFEFSEPEWDPHREVYIVEGVELHGTSESDVRQCVVHVNPNGVVTHIAAELITDQGSLRTEVNGQTSNAISVGTPDWVDEIESDEFTPSWVYRTGKSPYTTVGNDVLYVSSERGIDAVDRYDGSEIWSVEIPSTRSPHTVVDDTVYLEGDDEGVYAIDTNAGNQRDGSVLWSHEVATRLAVPEVSGDLVLFLGLDAVYAYERNNGTHAWTYTPTTSFSNSLVVDNGPAFLSDVRGEMFAIDTDTGSELWTTDFATDYWVSPELVYDGALYAGGYQGGVYRINVDDGTVEWRVQTADMLTRVAANNGILYASNREGEVYALDPETGSVEWQSDVGNDAAVYPRQGAVYVTGSDTTFYRLAVVDGSQRWTFDADASFGVPTFTDDAIYVGTRSANGSLYALNPEEGSVRWHGNTGGAVRQAPTVTDEWVYASEYRGYRVFAFRNPPSERPLPNASRLSDGALVLGDVDDAAYGDSIDILISVYGFGGNKNDVPVTLEVENADISASNSVTLGASDPGEHTFVVDSLDFGIGESEFTVTAGDLSETASVTVTELGAVENGDTASENQTSVDENGGNGRDGRELLAIGAGGGGLAALLSGYAFLQRGDDDSESDEGKSTDTSAESLRQRAETAVSSAEQALTDGEYETAIEQYATALENYRNARERLAVDDENHAAITTAIETVRRERDRVRELQTERDEVRELLSAAERSFQSAIATHARGKRVPARIRYREARNAFESALDRVEAGDGNPLPLTVSVGVEDWSPPAELTELPSIDRETADRLEEHGYETAADLRANDDALADLEDDTVIETADVVRLRALSCWHGTDEYAFEEPADIESRYDRAMAGFDAVN